MPVQKKMLYTDFAALKDICGLQLGTMGGIGF